MQVVDTPPTGFTFVPRQRPPVQTLNRANYSCFAEAVLPERSVDELAGQRQGALVTAKGVYTNRAVGSSPERIPTRTTTPAQRR